MIRITTRADDDAAKKRPQSTTTATSDPSPEEQRNFVEIVYDFEKCSAQVQLALGVIMAALAEESRFKTRHYKPDDARRRLHAICNEPAVLDGFERFVEQGVVDARFVGAMNGNNLAFYYLLFGEGEMFTAQQLAG